MRDIIIFGLGNNDNKYLKTRHNAGRILVDTLAELLKITFVKAKGYHYTRSTIGHDNIWLIYSDGYMNESGLPLSNFLNYFKIPTQTAVLVICQDDSDQFSGRRKISVGGGSAGHHGINSIYSHLQGWKFDPSNILRLKLGVRPPANRQKSETFVLQNLSLEELESIRNFVQDLLLPNLSLLTTNTPKLQSLINFPK